MVNTLHPSPWRRRLLISVALGHPITCVQAWADDLSDIGVTALRAAHPQITGAGVIVAMPEATTVNDGTDLNDYEVNPVAAGTTAPITYISSKGVVSASFPNNIGVESAHANIVASHLFGASTGAAPGVASVLNYHDDYLVNNMIIDDAPTAPNLASPPQVITQSFILNSTDNSELLMVEQAYDNFVASHQITIVTASGLTDIPFPSTAFNVISVGASDSGIPVGPYQGRSKPDISAPGGATSFSTPYVSGIAALLVQAGQEGVGGPNTRNAAVAPRTLKALLLNGASKPEGWSHSTTLPLDVKFGSGIVNAFNSYQNLAAGLAAPASTTLVPLNQSHPAATGAPIPSQGWNQNNINSNAASDAVDHYLLDLSNTGTSAYFALTATLAWERHVSSVDINNLDFFLVNASDNSIVASSVSIPNNVEYLASIVLTPGIYDLQVLKHGGSIASGSVVSNQETYAVAWNAAVAGSASTLSSPNGFLECSHTMTLPSISGVNSLQIDTGVTLTSSSVVTGSLFLNGIHILRGPAFVHTLNIAGSANAWLGKLDLTDNALIVQTTAAAKTAALATLQNQVLSGNNAGSWTGPGITSSTAAADPSRKTVVVVDNALLGLSTFMGFSTDANSLLIATTYFGDTNLDRKVDVTDLGVLAIHYGTAASNGILQGDFNGDGVVDVTDLGILASAYGLGTQGAFDAAIAQFPNLPASVPEPASLLLLSLGGTFLLRRNPRRISLG